MKLIMKNQVCRRFKSFAEGCPICKLLKFDSQTLEFEYFYIGSLKDIFWLFILEQTRNIFSQCFTPVPSFYQLGTFELDRVNFLRHFLSTSKYVQSFQLLKLCFTVALHHRLPNYPIVYEAFASCLRSSS